MTKDGLLDKNSYLLGLLDRKPWVGLTDEEICNLEGFYDSMTKEDFFKAIREVENKIKEKNYV
jgi:hypothetical protein